MDIKVFTKYYKLYLKDKVLPISCGLDSDHPGMVPNLEIDEEGNDIIFLYCLGCNYKMFPGKELYENIKSLLEKFEIDVYD